MNDGSDRRYVGNIDGFISPQPPPKPALPKQPVQAQATLNKATNFPQYYSSYTPDTNASNLKPSVKKKRSLRRKIAYAGLTILIIGFGIGAWYGNAIIGSLDKVLHGNVFSDVHAFFSTTKLKGEDQGRVNILLAGDSADDPGHAGADLTDSIMVVSLDTTNHTGFMLSIPRDLWVNVPGWGHEKINAANEAANFSEAGYPSGGMGQLEQVVSTDLGIPIDYYALINYSAFKDSVNAVGGIAINIQSTDPRGIYDSFTNLKLPNGNINLTGQQALSLARARGDDSAGDISYGFTNSDFTRTKYQREMLISLSQKAKNIGVITNPLKVSELFKSISNNVKTDLNLQDVLRLNQLTKGVNLSSLQSLTYAYGGTNDIIKGYLTLDGQDALIPTQGVDEFGQLQQYYQQLTSNNPVVREAPNAVVLNGSGVTGAAHKEGTVLTSDGFDIKGVADANGLYSSSMIVDLTNGKKPASLSLLKSILGKNTQVSTTVTTGESSEAGNYSADFVIILGSNAGTVQVP